MHLVLLSALLLFVAHHGCMASTPQRFNLARLSVRKCFLLLILLESGDDPCLDRSCFFFILTLVHIAANYRTSKAPDAMHLFLSFLVQDYLIFLGSFNSDLFHVFFVHLNSQLAHLFT